MEGDVALVRPMFAMLKDMVEVLGKQQFLIEGLRQSYGGLLAVLAGAGESAASPTRSPAQDAAISKAAKEIAELETLFSREPEPGETKTP
jgi:hypothetical protein